MTNFGEAAFGVGAGSTVSMIDGATCDATHHSGCRQTPPAFTSGNGPLQVAIDQAADSVYVLNLGDNAVAVVNGAASTLPTP